MSNNTVETGYRSNPLLKKVGQNIDFTEDQLLEFLKCKNDPVYFVKNYVKIVSKDEGLIPFKLYDFQEEMINVIHNNNRVVIKCPRQVGKCVDYDTMITVRNKKTGEQINISIGDLFLKSLSNQQNEPKF